MNNENDTTQSSNIGEATAQVASFIQSGDIESAVRLSGEMLAGADSRLRKCYINKADMTDAVDSFVEAAALHVYCLRLAKASDDALLCAVGSLLTLEVYKISQAVGAADKMRLYDFAVRSAIDSFERRGDATDADTESHRGYILSYLASLLYHYYRNAVDAGCDAPVINEVYSFLKAISGSGAIQSPTIRLGDTDVDPGNAGPLLVDIMSRAAALGIG